MPGERTKVGWLRRTPALLDDRGTPVTLADMSSLRASVYGSNPPFPWKRLAAWLAIALIVGWFLLSQFSASSPRFPFMFLLLAPSLLPWAHWRRGGTQKAAHADRVACASLARAGRCGGCGFSLLEFEPDHTGCVACPECGATWNAQRWRSRPKNANELANRSIERGPPPASSDDRGALIAEPYSWEPQWCDRIVARRIRRELTPRHSQLFKQFQAAASTRLKRRSMRIAGLLLAAVMLTFAAFAFLGFTGIDLWFYGLAAFIAFMLFVLLVVIGQATFDTRGLALSHSLCPACGELLDADAPREFDGCILCPGCAAAWKADAVGVTSQGCERTTLPSGAASSAPVEDPVRG